MAREVTSVGPQRFSDRNTVGPARIVGGLAGPWWPVCAVLLRPWAVMFFQRCTASVQRGGATVGSSAERLMR